MMVGDLVDFQIDPVKMVNAQTSGNLATIPIVAGFLFTNRVTTVPFCLKMRVFVKHQTYFHFEMRLDVVTTMLRIPHSSENIRQ